MDSRNQITILETTGFFSKDFEPKLHDGMHMASGHTQTNKKCFDLGNNL